MYIFVQTNKNNMIMSETSFNNLQAYLLETLSQNEMLALGECLINRVKNKKGNLKPYTQEEIDARIDLSERQSAEGKVKSTYEVFKKYEKEIAEWRAENEIRYAG